MTKFSIWALMRRKSFGLLIQCESYRMREEWAITTPPFIVYKPDSGMYSFCWLRHFYGGKQALTVLRIIGRQCLLAFGPVPDPWLFFFFFPRKWFLFTLCIFIWLIGDRKAARTHTAILSEWPAQGRTPVSSLLSSSCPRPCYQLTACGDFLLDSKEVFLAQL
jgi:hypothetical protein